MNLNLALIRESFDAIRPHSLEVVSHFYDTLFEKHPEARPLLGKMDFERQKKALIASLAHIIEYADEKDHVTDYLRKLGGRTLNYSIQDEHFGWVSEALFSTFEYYLDENWTAELKEQWTMIYGMIAETMKEGLKQGNLKECKKAASGPLPVVAPKAELTIHEIAKNMAHELFTKALEEAVNDTFLEVAREKAREILRKALEMEAKEMLREVTSRKSA